MNSFSASELLGKSSWNIKLKSINSQTTDSTRQPSPDLDSMPKYLTRYVLAALFFIKKEMVKFFFISGVLQDEKAAKYFFICSGL